jgi:hypothetical protein
LLLHELLNELLTNHVDRVLFTIININVLELFVIAEEEVANDDIDDLSTDEEFVRVATLALACDQGKGVARLRAYK